MSNWRDPQPSDYELPPRSSLVFDESLKNNRTEFSNKSLNRLLVKWCRKRFILSIFILSILSILVYVVCSPTIINSLKSSPNAKNTNYVPKDYEDNSYIENIAIATREFDERSKGEAKTILTQLRLVADKIENPSEKINALVEIAISYEKIGENQIASEALYSALEELQQIEDNTLKKKNSKRIIEASQEIVAKEELNKLYEIVDE